MVSSNVHSADLKHFYWSPKPTVIGHFKDQTFSEVDKKSWPNHISCNFFHFNKVDSMSGKNAEKLSKTIELE